jgi:hypothetical protein
MELSDRWVHFRIADVFEPKPQSLLLELHGSDLLQGHVVGVTDSGEPGGRYVIVWVEGINRDLIVPESRVKVSC